MEWISVKDKKPEQYQRVVVFKVDVAMICYGTAIFSAGKFLLDTTMVKSFDKAMDYSDKVISGVSHWAQLTPPPTA